MDPSDFYVYKNAVIVVKFVVFHYQPNIMSPREQEILQKSVQFLAKELSPSHIYLFGSRAKESDREGSDFDFALDCPTPSSDKLRALKDQLDKLAGLYSVDIVFLNDVDPEFRQLILTTGRLVYEQN